MDTRPIGIFDSGAGGLTVLHECLVTLPHEDFLYLGDGARCPYGPRPRDEIRRFAHEIASYLEDAGVKLIVAACNSATAAALPQLQEKLRVPVIGVLAPEAHAAVQATRNRRIGVLATEATVASGRYEEAVHALDAGAHVFSTACPELVPLIESAAPNEDVDAAVREYARPLKASEVDTVILGCTHYPAIQAGLRAGLRPKDDADLLRGRDRARGGRDAGAKSDRERPGPRRALPLPDDGARGRIPCARGALPPAPPRRGGTGGDPRPRAGGGLMRE